MSQSTITKQPRKTTTTKLLDLTLAKVENLEKAYFIKNKGNCDRLHGYAIDNLTVILNQEDGWIKVLEPKLQMGDRIKGSSQLVWLTTSSQRLDKYDEPMYGSKKSGKEDIKKYKLYYDSIGLLLSKS